MFNVASGLGDRFKSVVKDLEATGASLQARASHAAGPLSPEAAKSEGITSPSKSPSFVATGFLSDGLKRGFALGRSSMEGHARTHSGEGHGRSVSGTTASQTGQAQGEKGPTELKDIPSSPLPEAVPSRPASPARFLNSSFALGSLNSTRSPTPNPTKSPKPQSPTPALLPTVKPNPSDPTTYPLPPSPPLEPILSPELELSLPQYADPLGASPLLPPQDDANAITPPKIGIYVATPDLTEEESKESMDAGEANAKVSAKDQQTGGKTIGDLPAATPTPQSASSKEIDNVLPSPRASIEGEDDVNKKLAATERRYEGERLARVEDD